MKRKQAFEKLQIICERLNEINTTKLFIIPVRLNLYGSILTNKPNPADIDLLLQFKYKDINNVLYRISYDKVLPEQQVAKYLKNRMRNIHIEFLELTNSNLNDWLIEHCMPLNTPMKVIWNENLDWREALTEAENNPIFHNADLERHQKYMQKKLKTIIENKGEQAAKECFEKYGRNLEINIK